MLQSKTFVKKTKRGKILKVGRRRNSKLAMQTWEEVQNTTTALLPGWESPSCVRNSNDLEKLDLISRS